MLVNFVYKTIPFHVNPGNFHPRKMHFCRCLPNSDNHPSIPQRILIILIRCSTLSFLFRSKSSDRSPAQVMQYASTERNFGQVAEQNFYDAVLAHGDGTLVNAPSYNTLRGNNTSYDGFCICRYVDILSVSFIGFITCTTITCCVVLFVAFTKYQHRQRQERRVGRSQVFPQLRNSNNL